jgi:hypothetical protein
MRYLSAFNFICHLCEKTLAARSDELYYFPAEDFVYHRHAAEFFRALMIMPDGAVRVSQVDSVAASVLQRYKLVLGPENTVVPAGSGPAALKKSSGKFFTSMQRQHRRIDVAKIQVRIGDE